jgi:hypothetical protein
MNSTDLSLSKLFVVLFQSYLSKCPCMQELSGMSEAARAIEQPAVPGREGKAYLS